MLYVLQQHTTLPALQPPMNNTETKLMGIFGQWTIEKSLAYIWIQYVFYRNWKSCRYIVIP